MTLMQEQIWIVKENQEKRFVQMLKDNALLTHKLSEKLALNETLIKEKNRELERIKQVMQGLRNAKGGSSISNAAYLDNQSNT